MLFLIISSLVTWVHGQSFDVPSNWRKPSSDRPLSERRSIAQTTLESLISVIDLEDGTSEGMNHDQWASANVPASIAQHDFISASQDNHVVVSNTIAASRNANPAYFDSTITLEDFTSDALMWGLAALYGARAYNDTGLSEAAEGVWNVATQFAVSAEDGDRGYQHSRNVSFTVDCVPNVTSAGAVFWRAQTPSDLGCNGETVGAYVALSAHLWERTGNLTYLKAARQSASFVSSHMYIPLYQIITDTYELLKCDDNGRQFTYNQGLFLEGLSILSSAPVPDKATWSNLTATLVASTLQFPAWTSSDDSIAGVLIESIETVGAVANPAQFAESFVWRNAFIRALYEVWRRSNSSSPMANFIEAFMMVQYNALLDLASDNGSFYSPLWEGPQLIEKVSWGQLSAMDVLSASIGMTSANSSTTGPATTIPPGYTSSPSTATRSPPISDGTIAGIVVGVVAGLLVTVAGIFIIVRSNRRRALRSVDGTTPGTLEDIEPFPPGYNTIVQPHMEQAAWASGHTKDRRGYGHGPLLYLDSSGPTVPDSIEPPSTSREGPALESALSRAIQQVVDRMQVSGAPPSYAGR
ncbi:unnamed protein product [Peniophora sp. CBMAI 1063]|nr:unnamed protein product [Peniophora sp. CBMAI 1063]